MVDSKPSHYQLQSGVQLLDIITDAVCVSKTSTLYLCLLGHVRLVFMEKCAEHIHIHIYMHIYIYIIAAFFYVNE